MQKTLSKVKASVWSARHVLTLRWVAQAFIINSTCGINDNGICIQAVYLCDCV